MIKLKLLFCLIITLLKVHNTSYSQNLTSKISPLLLYTINSPSTKSKIDTVLIYYNDIKCFTTFIDSTKIRIKKIDTKNKFCKIILPVKFIPQIVNLACVDFADIYIQPTTEILTIGYEKKMHGINKHLFNNPSINGQHIVIGVKERKIDIDDIDLQKRSVNSSIVDNQIDQHATTIATLIGGAGNSYHTSRGLANRSQFFSSSFSNLFPDDSSTLKASNVSVQNHSYGTAIQNYYGPEARAYDEQLYKNPNFLHVFSSGNAGLLSSSNGIYSGITEYANCTGNFKMAKNVITVGAIDTGGSLLPFSSKGPLYDGRVAPQLIALGANGTSDAAALVTGTIALLQQMYQNSHNNQLPNAAIIKSLLYNTADKANLPLLSYASGYGKLDVNKAIHSMQKTISERVLLEMEKNGQQI